MTRRQPRDGGRYPSILLTAAACAVVIATGAGSGPPQSGSATLAFRESSVEPRVARVAAWQGGRVTATTGEQVNVFVSEAYGPEGVQRWADFIARLPHGSELGILTAYVATYDELRELCGAGALGCYWSNELAAIGETVGGVTPEEVVAHEYGHHVAWNRSNAPWLAVDWGTKRWASHASICARAAVKNVFPGDENQYYRFNPGEAFAEVYRVMSEVKAGATSFTWTLVDSSFYPDATALRAAADDVLTPWTATTARTVAARFREKGPKTWTLIVATALDGSFDARLTMPPGTLYDISLLSADGKTTFAKSLWTGVGAKTVTFQVCGQRTMLLRVTRKGEPGRFRVTYSRP